MDKNKVKTIRISVLVAVFLVAILVGKFVDYNFYFALAMYGVIYIASAYDILYKAGRNISRGKVFDENFLMTVASLGAFVLGIVERSGDFAESVAVILFYQVGELFQDYAVGKSRKSISSLMDIRPDTARVLRNGVQTEVYPEEVMVGESVFVIAGEKIPLDGTVVNGHGNLNTCALTGESAPVFVKEGDAVMSGTIALDGNLEIKVEKEFYDSTVSKILDMVENASGKKAKTENFISTFAKYYTPFVVFSALALAIIPSLIFGLANGDWQWAIWIKRALTFLVVSCPCALVISIPLGFFGGIGGASSKGILIKGANYIEQLNKVNGIFFDKTGTLTTGEFSVSGVYPEDKREEVLKYAAICEAHSSHPIAVGIVKAYKGEIPSGYQIEEIAGKGVKATKRNEGILVRNVDSAHPIAEGTDKAYKGEIPSDYQIEEIAGKDVKATKDNEEILVGNADLLRDANIDFETGNNDKTAVYIAINGVYLGVIEVADTVKADAKPTIDELKKHGVKVAMLTGDNERAAKRVADELGIDEYYAKLLPQDKLKIVDEKIANKKPNDVYAFVGDGINDAPVLMRADVGVSMGGVGSDSAIEASDVVLMHDNISDIVKAKKIARKTMSIVIENIVFALGVKAAVLILSAVGIANMWLAVFADVGVAVLAILNSMRALRNK